MRSLDAERTTRSRAQLQLGADDSENDGQLTDAELLADVAKITGKAMSVSHGTIPRRGSLRIVRSTAK